MMGQQCFLLENSHKGPSHISPPNARVGLLHVRFFRHSSFLSIIHSLHPRQTFFLSLQLDELFHHIIQFLPYPNPPRHHRDSVYRSVQVIPILVIFHLALVVGESTF